jgi:SAM-dependent methyltransferase
MSDRVLPCDFGLTARDYATHRPGFPGVFFERVEALGLARAGARVLDLGTGTGAIALELAARGCDVVGLDPSEGMLAEAERVAREAKLQVSWMRGFAEETGLPDASFDLVCAGQCWHWFDRRRACAEVMRLVRPGGHAMIAYFSYLCDPGTVGAATEELVLRHNPTWQWAGDDGRHPRYGVHLGKEGFADVTTFEIDLPVAFTHESWRGRFRACNGVIALPEDGIDAFDAELATMLQERFPEPVVSMHRVYGIVGRKPA